MVVERSRTRYPRRISARRHSVLALSAFATKIGRSLVPAVLLDAGGQLSRNELAARAGLTSNADTFGTYLSRLRSNDLVSVAGSVVRIADTLCG